MPRTLLAEHEHDNTWNLALPSPHKAFLCDSSPCKYPLLQSLHLGQKVCKKYAKVTNKHQETYRNLNPRSERSESSLTGSANSDDQPGQKLCPHRLSNKAAIRRFYYRTTIIGSPVTVAEDGSCNKVASTRPLAIHIH